MKRFLPKSEFSRNVLTLMTGTTIAQIIPFAIAPILSRIYTPEDFGSFAFYMAIASTIAVVATGRYELAIMLPSSNSAAEQLVFAGTIILLLISMLSLLVFSAGVFIYGYAPIFLTIPFLVIFIAMTNILDKYNNRIKNYKVMACQRITKTSTESIVSLTGGGILSLKQGLIYGSILGYAASFFYMLSINYNSMKKALAKTNIKKIKMLARSYKNFPKYNLPHAALNTLSANAPVFLIPIYFDNSILGRYSFGLKIIQAPLGLISMSIYNVFSQKLAEQHSKGDDVKPLFLKMLKSVLLMILAMAPMLLFTGELFAFAFGPQWREAGVYVQILAPWILLGFVVSCFASIPLIFGKQKKALLLEIASAFVQVAPFVIGVNMFSLGIKSVLMISMIMYTSLLFYSLNWYYGMIKGVK